MKRMFFVMGLLSLLSLSVAAQERAMRWENVTALYFAATNGTDRDNALQQYLLFDDAVLNRNRSLYRQYETFAKEFTTMSINASASGVNKEIDDVVAEVKKMIKEHPEMADELNAQLKEVEKMRGEYNGHVNEEIKEYTYNPKELLEKLTNISQGKRTYTAYKDIGNGLYAVQTGACYGPLEPDAFKRVKTPEKNKFSWGAIDYDGNVILKPIYSDVDDREKWDMIFLAIKDKSGAVRLGACGYDGRVRIPFVYTGCMGYHDGGENGICAYTKGDKWGFVDFDNKMLFPFEFARVKYHAYFEVSKDGKNFGIIDDGLAKMVVPMKYKGLWDYMETYLEMERFDNKIDCYDKKTFRLVKTEPKPHD
jgi:hypothetical protein